jgi:hypothetical protein
MGHEGLPPKRPRRRVAAPFPVPTGCTPKTHAAEVAAYIVDMTAGLARMAGDARLDMLTYFLNLARMEAEACRQSYGDSARSG